MTPMPPSNAWFVYPKPNLRARLRLFCFPYAGGGSWSYSAWPAGVLETTEVWRVRLPGRESRLAEPAFTRLEPLVTALAQVILPYLDMPFAFFGHSMGGLISFELLQELRRQHAPAPVRLFVSGHRAPHLPHRQPPIHHLPTSEFIVQLRRLNGTPEEVLHDAELMRVFLPVLRADFAIFETYVYIAKHPPLACPISVFGGLQDPDVSYDELAAWRDYTCGAFIQRMLPGDHFFLHSAKALLLQALNQDLADSLSTT
jgi:medium-chain acyl-[acyl-carrier-protein] hydrolase